ncbi:hypothetical protein N0V84_001382 [Fusarium piperis]|uniref:Uncharacterized protein n=1 Tax=Fusarium piperis TaxID=1435070 RepID=A0A9W8WLE8_9HYPO|nr:hypothetical protein N0V84_001382 [Fusarium piperis]
MLGIESLPVVVRTVIPATGLSILIVKLHRSPPPAPLLLRNSRAQAEPSPDSEEELEMALARSGSNVNPAELAGAFPTGDERATLLANLELELNEQEYQWQAIRHTMLRDSQSTVSVGSPMRDSRHGQPFRRAQLEADNDLQSLLSQTGFRSKLASSSFPGLSSPTPPDTESEHEYDEEPEALVGQTENDAKAAKALWRPITPVAAAPTAPSLWTPASKAADMAPEEIPDTIRREKRYLEPLTIESDRLWEPSRSPKRQGNDASDASSRDVWVDNWRHAWDNGQQRVTHAEECECERERGHHHGGDGVDGRLRTGGVI